MKRILILMLLLGGCSFASSKESYIETPQGIESTKYEYKHNGKTYPLIKVNGVYYVVQDQDDQ